MKKIIALVLICILALSCTACSWHQGDTERQEQEMMEYVEKYHGAAEIVKKEHMILDTATYFTLKDKTDGFTYGIATMEVFMSDLGYTVEDDGHGHEAEEKTIVLEGNFTEAYISHMVENKIPKDELLALNEKYDDKNLDLSIIEYYATAINVVQYTTYDTIIMMSEMDFNAMNEMVDLLEKYDTRDALKDYIIPIYKATVNSDGQPTIATDTDGNPIAFGFYDFYLQSYFEEDDFEAVSMLHDYLRNIDAQNPQLVKVEHNVAQSTLTLPEGWAFLPDTTDTGSLATYELDGKTYTLFTKLCRHAFTTEQDEFGLHQGSFLDIMATERVGGRPVLISMYASMYPSYYTSIDLLIQEVTA